MTSLDNEMENKMNDKVEFKAGQIITTKTGEKARIVEVFEAQEILGVDFKEFDEKVEFNYWDVSFSDVKSVESK